MPPKSLFRILPRPREWDRCGLPAGLFRPVSPSGRNAPLPGRGTLGSTAPLRQRAATRRFLRSALQDPGRRDARMAEGGHDRVALPRGAMR